MILFLRVLLFVTLATTASIYLFHVEPNRLKHTARAELVTVELASKLIAHAGGAVEGGFYSNSLEALQASYDDGLRWAEIDLSMTTDGHVVLLHDWGRSWRYWFQTQKSGPVTLQEFRTTSMRDGLTQLSLPEFCSWLNEAPEMWIVLDFKDDHATLLDTVSSTCNSVVPRMVPQLPDTTLVEHARSLGFPRVAISSYYRGLSPDQLRSMVDTVDYIVIPVRLGIDAIASATRWADRVIVHTVNDAQEAQQLSEVGVAGIMTDTLRPRHSDVADPGKRSPAFQGSYQLPGTTPGSSPETTASSPPAIATP